MTRDGAWWNAASNLSRLYFSSLCILPWWLSFFLWFEWWWTLFALELNISVMCVKMIGEITWKFVRFSTSFAIIPKTIFVLENLPAVSTCRTLLKPDIFCYKVQVCVKNICCGSLLTYLGIALVNLDVMLIQILFTLEWSVSSIDSTLQLVSRQSGSSSMISNHMVREWLWS